MLADLGGIVREFNQPRQSVARWDERQRTVRNGRVRSRVIRRSYTTWLPGLWDSLEFAAFPTSADMGPSGAFESQSPANDAAISVLIGITTQVADWCRLLRVGADTDRGRMGKLVSGVTHHPQHFADLLGAAQGWRQDALMATGEEEPLRTINQSCPLCYERNALVMRADGSHVSCRRCLTVWGETQVGLLAVMLANNRTHETLSALA